MKSTRHKSICLLLAAIAMLPLVGCSDSYEPVEVSAEVSDREWPEPGTVEYVGSEPVPFMGQASPYNFELLHDATLADFDIEEAASQSVSGNGEWYVRADGGDVPLDTTNPPSETDAAVAVKIGPVQGRAGLAQTTYPLTLSSARIEATSWGLAFAPNELALVVEWPGDNNTTRRLIAIHPGDGEWHELTIGNFVYGVPANVRLTYEIARAGRTGGDVFMAPGKLRVREVGGSPLVGHNLVRNASFDAGAFFEKDGLAPWDIHAWRGNTIDTVEVVVDESVPDRHYIVRMPEITEGALGVYQRIDDLNETVQGKTLTFRLDGICDAPDRLELLLRLHAGGEPQVARAAHPGDGKWHELVATIEVSADAKPETVEIYGVQYAGDGTANIAIDNASVVFVDPNG